MNMDEKALPENKDTVGRFTKVSAAICKYCPACIVARKSPHSMVGRLLHHPMHSDNCPMWTAYQKVHGESQTS